MQIVYVKHFVADTVIKMSCIKWTGLLTILGPSTSSERLDRNSVFDTYIEHYKF